VDNNKDRRRKHVSTRKNSMGLREPVVLGDKQGGEHPVDEASMIPVSCPECSHKFRDVGSFIHHMWVMHEWESTQSLIYWGDHWGSNDAEKEED
jgi:hypothetical protein